MQEEAEEEEEGEEGRAFANKFPLYHYRIYTL